MSIDDILNSNLHKKKKTISIERDTSNLEEVRSLKTAYISLSRLYKQVKILNVIGNIFVRS